MNRFDTPTTIERIKRIRKEVPVSELYNELAEEATELAQAALKMNRVENDSNPTDLSAQECKLNLIEEYTDVLNIADRILELTPAWLIGDYKLMRWCKRLDEAREEKAEMTRTKGYCEIK